MLDDSFPTYRLASTTEDPLQATLFYTYNGSDPTRAYTLQRPAPSSSANQYAVALFDAQHQAVIYGEVLVKPEMQQPSLSAAELRTQSGSPPIAPVAPDSFSVLLYNPDQSIAVKRNAGGWNRADSWGFEIPERTFKLPSVSRLDQETGSNEVSDLSPKILFHWKRDGRLNRDMTCYMSGKSVGGKKSKEPDITVAMYRGEKQGDALSIYEPNMARVEVEDRKGLEVVLLLSAVVVRDLHFAPRQNPFNISSAGTASAPAPAGGARRGSRPLAPSPSDPTLVSGALGNAPPPARPPPNSNAAKQAEIEAETRRLQAMVAEEERQRRERLARQEEEQTRRMLQREQEEEAQRRRRQAEVDSETERLRREYGVQGQWPPQPSSSSSPPLPQRPFEATNAMANMSGALGTRWYGPPVVNNPQPPPPPRPSSAGPGPSTQQQQQRRPPQKNGRNKLSPPVPGGSSGPYAGPSGARASALSFFGGGKGDEDKRKKMKKKQSVHF